MLFLLLLRIAEDVDDDKDEARCSWCCCCCCCFDDVEEDTVLFVALFGRCFDYEWERCCCCCFIWFELCWLGDGGGTGVFYIKKYICTKLTLLLSCMDLSQVQKIPT